MTAPTRLPWHVTARVFFRLFAVQGSWNYEIMSGTGIGFCVEPALRLLPGGPDGAAYRAALARQSQYFNCHPYLAGVAVGALARAELDGEPAAKIDRFRTALCGPLGSVGDRLVWAAWLPFCSIVALFAFALGAGPVWVAGIFFVLYNLGHAWLRAWGLRVGWTHGLRVAKALGAPFLRDGPEWILRGAALILGLVLPLALFRLIGPGVKLLGVVLAVVAVGGTLLVRMHGRVEGWRVALVVLAAFVLYSVAG
jgi:PTS system mannose-specific IID component